MSTSDPSTPPSEQSSDSQTLVPLTRKLPLTKELIQALWERAFDEEIGLAIPVEDKTYLRATLHKWNLPGSEDFYIHAPNGNEIWIVRKGVDVEDL